VSLWLVWNVCYAVHILMLLCEQKFGFPLCFGLSWCPIFVYLSPFLACVIYRCDYYHFHFQVISEVDLRYTTV